MEAPSTTLISAKNVGCRFYQRRGLLRRSEHWALSDVSIELNSGESVGVVGRNGAGKSTLLQLLAGIILPTRGTIDKAPGVRASLLALRTGMQGTLSGRDNAVLSGMLLGMSQADVRSHLEQIKDFSELGNAFEDKVFTYSAGMKARLGFSTAVALDPEVVLIDETLGVGDLAFRQKSTELMVDRIRSNRSVVLVSHQGSTISELCNRAVWIENGENVAEGPADEIVKRYEDDIARRRHERRAKP